VHNNYYLIRQLIPCLVKTLSGTKIVHCFSQNKNELVLQFEDSKNNQFNIIAHFNPDFSCLAFPKEVKKARRNVALIFKDLNGLKVLAISKFENERAFLIGFEKSYALLFKLYGGQSNLILFKKQKSIELFKNSLQDDSKINLNNLERKIDQQENAIRNSLSDIKKVFPTLSKSMVQTIQEGIINLDEKSAVKAIRAYITKLENPLAYFISRDTGKVKFSLLPENEPLTKFSSPLEGLTYFFKLHLKEKSFSLKRTQLKRDFEVKIKQTLAYVRKAITKKDDLANNKKYREIADLIMANIHLIKPNSSSIEVASFYTGGKILIKLNNRLNPGENAEKYYRKAKNVWIETKKLSETITKKELVINELRGELIKLENAESVSDLDAFKKMNLKIKKESRLPFKKFNLDGYTVLVGNNAKQNDLLTLKTAKKDDLFFHAKDVGGSHVILKQLSGQPFPKFILEKTAAIAAYYSKRRTDSLCAVGYTPKKYVRKPKGSAPGLVVVEREQVLLVKPELPS